MRACRTARPVALAAALAALSFGALAQPTTTTITVTGRAAPRLGIGGFGDQPLARTPIQATVLGREALADAGVDTLGGIGRLDPGVADAYNAVGYWPGLAVRGYTLDNRANFRRDGLPVNAETVLMLDNKERVELLKGTSGIQAGTSSPGGLVNLVVKRPDNGPVRTATLGWQQRGSWLAAVDLGDRFGTGGAFGLRLNAAYEHLDPVTRDTQGHRRLLALAGDWRPSPDARLEAELEHSHQQQPSVAAFSLLGDAVPDPSSIDPRVNLNHQPWSGPVAMDGTTASLRWQQRLAGAWHFTAHAMSQRLRTDDRTAFPYGDYSDLAYSCTWCNRYAADGRFSYWEYLSLNERRDSDALDLSVAGQATTGVLRHTLQAGVLVTRLRARFQDQVFALARDPADPLLAGQGRVDGSGTTLPSDGTLDANTDRDERSTEWYLRDAITLGERWQLWAGLRHVRLDRASRRTSPDADGSLRETDYVQRATTPWLAVSHQLTPEAMVYASWGRGLETDVAPNRTFYANRGQPLPALQSRQTELGVKVDAGTVSGSLAAFAIARPLAADVGICSSGVPDSCVRRGDGSQRHRGIEAQAAAQLGGWTVHGGLLLLDAERRSDSDPAVDGTRPVNVPARSLRVGASTRIAALPGLELGGTVVAEGDRVVLADDPVLRIPGWSRLDLAARWQQRHGDATLTWRVGLDNALDRRAWKESPTQFGHVYLYPLAPRQWRASVQAAF